MASEKQSPFDNGSAAELPPSNLYRRRRKTIFALGGIAILATGFAAGAGVSMFCDNSFTGSIQALVSPLSPSSPDSPLHNLLGRQLTTDILDTSAYVSVKPAPRPNKLFGPDIPSQVAAAEKKAQGTESIEKREAEEPFYSRIFSQRNVEKRGVWQPAIGTNWTYQLNEPPTSSQLQNPGQFAVWDIDLFDTPVSTIQTIHAAGSKVICYFSAGTYENWRSDVNKFKTADIGAPMGDWPGENWVNVMSRSLRSVMAARLDLAKQKGCDAVDPDNMDGYNHNTGFALTQTDAVSYISYLATQASQRGLAIGLKNSGDILPKVVSQIQFSVEEACYQYNECGIYAPLTAAGKPVFHVEYPKGYGVVNTAPASKSTMNGICACVPQWGFSPIVKNNNLDSWQQQCR